MAQQTAVDWLEKHLKNFPHIKHSFSFKDLIKQAKQMEKEQIDKAWEDHKYNKWGNENTVIDGKDYYNNTHS